MLSVHSIKDAALLRSSGSDDSRSFRKVLLTPWIAGAFLSGVAVAPVHAADGAFADRSSPVPPAGQSTVNVRALNNASEPGRLNFSVFLDKPSAVPVYVHFNTHAKTEGLDSVGSYRLATTGADFDYQDGNLVFQPGETSKTVSVVVHDDALDEPAEIVVLSVGSITNAQPASRPPNRDPLCGLYSFCTDTFCCVCGIIDDNDPAVEVVIDDASAREDSDTLDFTVRLSAHTEKTIQFEVRTRDATAEGGKDYEAIMRTVPFRTETLSGTLSVRVLDDSEAERDETFELSISNSANEVVIVDGTATGSILDYGDLPQLTIAEASPRGVLGTSLLSADTHTYLVGEGNGAQANRYYFYVVMSITRTSPITVNYAMADGDAIFGDDYELQWSPAHGRHGQYRAVPAQGTLKFEPGQRFQRMSVLAIDDRWKEPTETMTFTLSSPNGATLGATSVGFGILDNDAPPQLSVAGVSGDEGSTLGFVVSASTASWREVEVDYATVDGTAVAGQDYRAAQGTLTFAAGDVSRTVSVATIDDKRDEQAEAFALTLSSPTYATLGVASADGTILDKGALPPLSVAGVSGDEGSALDFVVSLASASADTVTVNYQTRDGAALAGQDYRAAQGTLTFAPGVMSRTVSVATLDDTLEEAAEAFVLTLSSLADPTLVVASADGTIVDNDTPLLSVAGTSGDEGSVLDFVVSASSASAFTMAVDYQTGDGTAVSSQDYQAVRGTLTLAPGVTSGTVSVATLDDAQDEPEETFALALSSPVNARLAVASADTTIIDNDDPPQFSVAAGATASEGRALDFVVSTPTTSWGNTKVRFATANGTARANQDYRPTSGTLTFAPGEASRTVSVVTLEDGLSEPVETLALNLSWPRGYRPEGRKLVAPSAVGEIVDADSGPALSVMGFSNEEGRVVTFLVTARRRSPDTMTVDYQTRDGTAVSGQDYQAAQGTLTFAPGEWYKKVRVTTLDDVLHESAETFALALSSPTNAGLNVATADGTILDNDAPELSVAGVSGVEGGALDFAVSLSFASGRTVTVNYGTADGTALAGQDYRAAQGTLTFAPGETSRTVSVSTLDDSLDEPAEAFAVTLSSPADATLARTRADGTIVDNDAAPQLSVAGISGDEGNALDFVVSASSASGQTVTVNYATADGTALADEDYQAAQGTLTLAPGETSGTVSVATLDDVLDEPAEAFALTLSSPANATLAAASAEGWILDDDAGPQLSVAGASGAEGSAVKFVVSASSIGGQTITVDYATADGSAVAGQDYRAAQGTLAFAPGETRKTVSVATRDDALIEGTETFVLTLSSSSDVNFGTRTATGTIIDNDAARVVLTAVPASVPEGAGPTSVRVTAVLEGALRDVATAVRVSVTGGSAEESVDFAAVPDFEIEVAAQAASGTGTFTLTPVDDDQEEADETLTVSGVSDLAVDAAALSLQDDDERSLETFRVLLFEAASNPLRQGFLRVINNSPRSGEVIIEATDDSGDRRDPVTLFIEQGHASHFNSIDLETGNPAKRLSGGVGAPVRGDWRLKMSTTLDVDVLAYSRTKDSQSRTADAFVTAMNEVAPVVDGMCRVVFLNPGANQAQKSMLRLINTGLDDVEATVDGMDDAGQASGTVRVSVPGLQTVTLTAEELETGVAAGIVAGRLGPGTGKWRLTVSANPALVAKALLLSVDKLTNLSSSRGVRTVPVFPPMSEPDWTGLLRVINRSPESGEVTLTATDATGRAYEPLTLTLGARAAMHFDSADLELGNPGKGLTGSTGAGLGNWRLELDSPLDVHAVAYARSHDGFLTSIHDLVPRTNGVHRANFFNPASNDRQVSWLHLLSDSDADALVTITGRDDRGDSPGTSVRLWVPAGTAVSLPSAALESGEHDLIEGGALGDGAGKWRLEVYSDRPLKVMSLLVSPTGHLSNVSTAIDPYDATRPESGSGG